MHIYIDGAEPRGAARPVVTRRSATDIRTDIHRCATPQGERERVGMAHRGVTPWAYTHMNHHDVRGQRNEKPGTQSIHNGLGNRKVHTSMLPLDTATLVSCAI